MWPLSLGCAIVGDVGFVDNLSAFFVEGNDFGALTAIISLIVTAGR